MIDTRDKKRGALAKLWSFFAAMDDLADDEGLTRLNNRVEHLEERLAALEGGAAGPARSSGPRSSSDPSVGGR